MPRPLRRFKVLDVFFSGEDLAWSSRAFWTTLTSPVAIAALMAFFMAEASWRATSRAFWDLVSCDLVISNLASIWAFSRRIAPTSDFFWWSSQARSASLRAMARPPGESIGVKAEDVVDAAPPTLRSSLMGGTAAEEAFCPAHAASCCCSSSSRLETSASCCVSLSRSFSPDKFTTLGVADKVSVTVPSETSGSSEISFLSCSMRFTASSAISVPGALAVCSPTAASSSPYPWMYDVTRNRSSSWTASLSPFIATARRALLTASATSAAWPVMSSELVTSPFSPSPWAASTSSSN
mmetsp:Transcript_1932/g.6293  ORF Transcript_1932/g.6293 Transcript_1932/m.6293 type:complete len:295 (-) Transcript_1932:1661-2545(-)